MSDVLELLRERPVFRALSPVDRETAARAASIRSYSKGDTIFEEGEPSDAFYTIASGRVKIFKMLPSGKDLILEVFGTGDPLGAAAAYDGRPFPASAVALEDTTCLVIPRPEFFKLLEQHPTLVRGLLLGLTHRLVELTNRLAELSGGTIERRFARRFSSLPRRWVVRNGAARLFRCRFPVRNSRHDRHDDRNLHRIMSRWGKLGIVRTEKDGFVVLNKDALEAVGES
jgi:CRP-like cAMP-binding protein